MIGTRALVKKEVGGGGPPDGSSAKSLHRREEWLEAERRETFKVQRRYRHVAQPECALCRDESVWVTKHLHFSCFLIIQ